MSISRKKLLYLSSLALLAGFTFSIFVIVGQTGLQVEDIRSFAKGNKSKTASQAYADKLIAQREKSGGCVGAACLADVVARSAKENPDYYNSLKGSAKGSAGANTLAVLEMTKIATGELKTTDSEAKNAVDYCNAHGGSDCSVPKNMETFLQNTNSDLNTIYKSTTESPGTTQVPGAVSKDYTSCIKYGNTPSDCAYLMPSTSSAPNAPGITPVPVPVAPVTTPVAVTPGAFQPIPSSYYSQVDPGWADQLIPGQNKLFAQAGCGEVTVANILTHAGIPTNPNQASTLISKDQSGSGTAYGDDIAALTQKGFQADQYYGSFKDLPKFMGPRDVVWLSVIANNKTYKNMGHHTYIDGYTIVDGKPVYNLRDPFFGNDMKCRADGDRGLSCSSPERSVELTANADTNNSGTGTVAVILTPPGP